MAAVQPRFSSHRQQSGLFHDACRAGAAPMEPHRETVAPPPQEQQLPPLFLHFPHGDGDGGRRHRRPATTGLRLGFNDGGSDHAHAARTSASFLPDGVATLFDDRYRNEMDMMIQEHAERLRRALADTRRRHSRSLLGAAEEFAARRVREKEADASKAARRGAELEERLARLRAEAAAWQAKAMSDQSTAAALHAQLQQAAAQARSGKAVPRVPSLAGLHRAASVQASLCVRRVRDRRVGLRGLPYVPLPGHRHRASCLLLTQANEQPTSRLKWPLNYKIS